MKVVITYGMYVCVCTYGIYVRNTFLLSTVQSIDDNDVPNASVVSSTREDGTVKDRSPHQADKNVEEAAPSSSAENEETNTMNSTDNSGNNDCNA